MKLRSRSRRREESLPELAEDIERLAKLAYPEATSAVLETLAKDQFIDALVDDELRLRVAQGRPATSSPWCLIRESFTLATKRRTRYVRTIQGSAPDEDRSAAAGRTVTNADNTVSENNEFLAELKLMTAELRKIVSDVNQRNKVPEKSHLERNVSVGRATLKDISNVNAQLLRGCRTNRFGETRSSRVCRERVDRDK
ncbi:Hypothetical predicted protein [Paramuricea clavata]|uniref:Uncharacterized protein n=1 Tax=Paramuricea clavata TaxID=317549 RepID=A0A7D9JMY4_PARCT|nr:Hypothetical predicted protein [Paramuricea clavata]CAB4032309.1 Hypothetical predicted protein [Paramuricea clavata]